GGVDGLLVEECIFDHNGWKRGVPGAQATIFNHNMYLHGSCTGVVTRGNISSRASATGISQRCAGLSEDNLLLQNPVGLYFGIEDNWPTVRSAVRNNVALDARDIDSINGRGFAYWISSLRSAEIYGNVAAAQRTGSDNVIAFRFTADLRSLAFTRNTVYDWTMGSSGVALSLDLPFARGVIASDNVFVQPTGGFLVEYVAPVGGDYGRVLGRNRYYTSNTEPHQFYYGTSYTEWANSGNEIFSQFGAPAMPDPQRDIATYMTTLGLTPSLEAFLSLARQQERTTWDDRFTAAAVNAYIRQGLGVGRRGCRADFNDDGQVNVLDIVEFQTAWSSGDPRGDFDLDGAWTSDDLIQFQGVFAAGCL
ncbi:MAG TPA: GC-type dockerin domain-anchored protein, partial [Vicinamibacterales bacterium]|nr:GC-type dockerin domain-anchored protein [Vicinamibacterales bacterium]